MTYIKYKLKKKLKNLTSKIIRLQTFPPIKNLLTNFKWFSGRNNQGFVTFNSKSKRVKRNYRLIDFYYYIINLPSLPLRIEYDPFRSSWICLLCYTNGVLCYILALHELVLLKRIYITNNPKLVKKFNAIPLILSNEGMLISNLENKYNSGAKLVRSAGTFGILLKKLENQFVLIKLPSKEQILLKNNCFARIGRISNIDKKFINYYKAGQVRKFGFRPITRGVAKNPIDHPHGGGGGKHLVTPFAKIAKNKPTKNPLKLNLNIVRSRKLAVRKIIIVKLKKLQKKKK